MATVTDTSNLPLYRGSPPEFDCSEGICLNEDFLFDCRRCTGMEKKIHICSTAEWKEFFCFFFTSKRRLEISLLLDYRSGHRDTHHLLVGASVESLGENSHHKHVDEERDEQRDGRLDEEIFVGLFHFFLVRPIHFSRLTRTFGHLMTCLIREVPYSWLRRKRGTL